MRILLKIIIGILFFLVPVSVLMILAILFALYKGEAFNENRLLVFAAIITATSAIKIMEFIIKRSSNKEHRKKKIYLE